MKTISKRLVTFVLAIVMILGVFPATAFAFEDADYSDTNATPQSILSDWVRDGVNIEKKANAPSLKNNYFSNKTYKVEGGGTLKYSQMFHSTSTTNSTGDESICCLNTVAFDKLSSDGKRKFLEDFFTSANACVYYSESKHAGKACSVSDATVIAVYNNLQGIEGMGTLLIASLLQNTKPNFVAANNIYAPFSGVVGVILGFLSIIIMALLGITMALDILYITIPAFQLIIGDAKSGQGQQNGAAKIGAKIVSTEAIKAVEVSQAGQNGEYKSAIGTYFGYRWKSLVLLGICLLYLVSGQIYTLVAKLIDLLSGFLGF